jgi:hypothetical protein
MYFTYIYIYIVQAKIEPKKNTFIVKITKLLFFIRGKGTKRSF